MTAQDWTWEEQNSGVTTTLNDVFFVGPDLGYAVGQSGVILKTTDRGVTWERQDTTLNVDFRTVHFVDANTGWIGGQVVSGNSKRMYKTVDGGNTWIPTEYVGATVDDLYFVNDTLGWAISDSIRITKDGGETWRTERLSSDLRAASLKDIHAASPEVVFACGTVMRNSSRRPTVLSRVELAVDNVFWGAPGSLTIDNDDDIRTIWSISTNLTFAGGSKGQVFKLEDSLSLDWSLNFTVPAGGGMNVSSIHFADENTGMFLTGIDNNLTLVYRTTDGAENWSAAPDTLNGFSNRLIMTNKSNAWVVGWQGGIYKGTSSTASARVIENLSAIEIFPNPAHSDCTVRINTKNSAPIQIDLINSTGACIRAIYNGVLTAGESSFNIDQFQNLAPGMYYVRFQSNGATQSMAVVKQ